jgi:predicted transcriptional regulator
MTNQQRLLEFIREHPGEDDDELARLTQIEPRQQVNQICNRLAKKGVLVREKGPRNKLVNRTR